MVNNEKQNVYFCLALLCEREKKGLVKEEQNVEKSSQENKKKQRYLNDLLGQHWSFMCPNVNKTVKKTADFASLW